VRRVRHNGEIRLNGNMIYIGAALLGEPIGPAENDHGWTVTMARSNSAPLFIAVTGCRRSEVLALQITSCPLSSFDGMRDAHKADDDTEPLFHTQITEPSAPARVSHPRPLRGSPRRASAIVM
jgi:hypothetical protein